MTPGESWAYVGVTLVCVALAFSFGFALGGLCRERLVAWELRLYRRKIRELEDEIAQLKGE